MTLLPPRRPGNRAYFLCSSEIPVPYRRDEAHAYFRSEPALRPGPHFRFLKYSAMLRNLRSHAVVLFGLRIIASHFSWHRLASSVSQSAAGGRDIGGIATSGRGAGGWGGRISGLSGRGGVGGSGGRMSGGRTGGGVGGWGGRMSGGRTGGGGRMSGVSGRGGQTGTSRT